MTSTHAKALPPAEVKAFEDILEVFNSPGWKHLLRQIEADAEAIGNVRNCQNLDYSRGQLSILDRFRTWPDTWAALYEAAQNGDLEVEADAFR